MADFPYEEIRADDGNYFATAAEAVAAGFDIDQVWSITEFDEGDGIVYGPPHHYVNVLGFIATKERHDHETYFEEPDDVDG